MVDPVEFSDADKGDGYSTVGWAHSHPGFGVFMSSVDISSQTKCFQSFFPDAVAMVMDPLSRIGMEFQFFRAINGKAKKIEYEYLVRRDV